MSADLDAALASTKLFKQQLEEALAIRYGNKGAKPMTTQTNSANDDAVGDLVAPFTLCADAIVERTDAKTGDLVYEVEKEGKVIYSTVTRPLAFAFMAGVNAVPSAPKKGAPAKESPPSGSRQAGGGKPESASVQSDNASSPSANSGQAQDKSSGATPPAPKAEPRKRAVL
jgi:hypothetical protein